MAALYMSRFAVAIFVIFSSTFPTTSAKNCNIPSRFWCDTKEIASECGVSQQCSEHEWLEYRDAPLVNLTLYYESLCPDCKNFFKHQLGPAYQKISSIMNLVLVPYGNARESKNGDIWEFQCQHGEQECQGNIIETCAIDIIKDISVYFPFILCMENSHASMPIIAAHQCAKSQLSAGKIPIDDIMNCTKSKHGNDLEHEMAVKTDALKPKHNYVPWVTLNGVHTDKIEKEADNNLVKLICDTYKGEKPSGCGDTKAKIHASINYN